MADLLKLIVLQYSSQLRAGTLYHYSEPGLLGTLLTPLKVREP